MDTDGYGVGGFEIWRLWVLLQRTARWSLQTSRYNRRVLQSMGRYNRQVIV